jgi:hypothetical protein
MADSSGLVIDDRGYFSLGGRRFVPAGVNYWPGSCGVEMWARWPEGEIQHDLDVLASLGLNSIRFFLRWQDFEPEAGQYNLLMFERLAQFLAWCGQRRLWAQPSLFVGWMSGGIFWPAWKAGRNVFADPFMVKRAAAFARKAAATIAPFHPYLLGIDQGNELDCLPDSPVASPGDVVHWCQSVNEAIRSAYPGCLIVSGNDQNQVVADVGWQLGRQPGTDYYSMHAYPVPNWHPVGFDGMTDPLCQSLLPFYVKCARAFGPVLAQEFGTIVTFGAEQQDRYLRAMLPACWEAGAGGFLWWCLRDITANVHPYVKNSFEGTLGLVDGQDQVKPGLEYFVEFAHSLPGRPASDALSGEVGLYWPKHFYLRDDPENPGNDPRQLSRQMIVAHFLLQQLGHRVRIVRGDQALDPTLPVLVIPGALLGADEAEALEAWVRAGKRLLWHGPDPVNWGHAYIHLLGARPVDYRAARPASINLWGEAWTLGGYPHGMRVEVAPTTAQVLARDEGGLPVVLANRVGQGSVIYTIPLVEDAIAGDAGDRERRDRWGRWYEATLAW